jgi:hypothetical protein
MLKGQQNAGRPKNAKAVLTHACQDDKKFTQLPIKPIERCSLLYLLIQSGATVHTSSASKVHPELLRGKIFSRVCRVPQARKSPGKKIDGTRSQRPHLQEALMSLLLKMCSRLYGYKNDAPIQVVGIPATGEILVEILIIATN